MVTMSQGVELETEATGGFLKSISRAVLGGESFFQNTYTAPPSGGSVESMLQQFSQLIVDSLAKDGLV